MVFLPIFRIFVKKEKRKLQKNLMTAAYNRWCQHFLNLNLLQKGCICNIRIESVLCERWSGLSWPLLQTKLPSKIQALLGLIIFDDMIVVMINNNKPNAKVIKLFIMQSYFEVPKDIILNLTHYFITKIPKKGELQEIVINHLSDNTFKDLSGFTKKVLRNRILF